MNGSSGGGGMVTVRFFAAAAEAAGEQETLAEPGRAADLRAALADRYGAELERVLGQCALMSDGGRLEDGSTVAAGATVDVLPPFAGG